MDTQATLDWLAQVSEQALQEAQQGNVTLANRLGKESAFSYYFNNVHTTRVMSPAQFAAQFPAYIREADRIRKEYEVVTKVEEQGSRLNKIEESLTKLYDLLKPLMEAQSQPEPPVEPKRKPGRPKKEQTPTETEDEPPAEDAPDGEA